MLKIGKRVKFIKTPEVRYDYGTGTIIDIEDFSSFKRYVVKLDKKPDIVFVSDELCFVKKELEEIDES